MKRLPTITATLILVSAFLPIPTAGTSSYTECENRCSGFSGQSRYQCLKTCIRAKKRQDAGGNRVKKKMERCEELCKDLSGLDSVRCLRLCLDKLEE